MSKYVIAQPPQLSGTTDQKLQALYSYLYRMNENLQVALSSIDGENFTPQGIVQIRGDAKETAQDARRSLEEQAVTLKSLIVKTAQTVQAEMGSIVRELHGEYVAKSDFGQYQESVSNEITATAQAIIQEYHYDSRIDAAQQANADFETYMTKTQQYIKTGLLYYDGTEARYGVAVGEKLTMVNGLITREDLCATFTSDRLSFWMRGVEVAYVSNSRLAIPVAYVEEQRMGDWKISRTNGFTIEWVGG